MMVKAFRYFTGLMLLVMAMAVSIPAQAQEAFYFEQTPAPDTTIQQNSLYQFTPPLVCDETQTDCSQGYNWSWNLDQDPYPEWLTFNADGQGTLTGTPTNSDVDETYTNIRIFAKNIATGAVAQLDPFSITVEDLNDPPETLSTFAPPSATEDKNYSYSIRVQDIDGDALTIQPTTTLPNWLTADGGGSWSFNRVTDSDTIWELTLTGTPKNADVGTADVGFTIDDSRVTDAELLTLTGTIQVKNSNDAPTAADIPSRTVPEGLYTETIYVTDVDQMVDTTEDVNIVAATLDLPDWLFDPDTGEALITKTPPAAGETQYTFVLEGTAGNYDVGEYTISIQFIDNSGATTTVSYPLTITNVNTAPTLTGVQDGQTLTAFEDDDSFALTVAASDIDINVAGEPADDLIFSITNQPSWTSFNPSTTEPTTYILSGKPANKDVGTYSDITITVSDGTENVSRTFSIQVENTPDPPSIVEATVPAATEDDSAYTHTFAATDPDLEITGITESLTFELVWPNTQPAWLTFTNDGVSEDNVARATLAASTAPLNADVGTIRGVKLKVTDSSGLSDTYTFDFVVENTNDKPTISGTPATTVKEDTLYAFKPTANDDDLKIPNSTEKLTFSISYTTSEGQTATNIPWAAFNTETGELSGTPGNDDVGVYSNIEIKVTDNSEAKALLPAFSITVQPVNDPPVISCTTPPRVDAIDPATETVGAGEALTFQPVVEDIDFDLEGNKDELFFYLDSQPSWIHIDTSTGKLTNLQNRPALDKVGEYNMVLNVSDGNPDGTASCEFIITVADFTIEPGDLDSYDGVTLNDVILGLQMMAGLPVYVYMDADVNGDGVIDMVEILYDLQVISEIR